MLQTSSFLIPGQTVWRRCETSRLAVLNDAAEYFGALRDTLLLAEWQVYIIGWDIHSKTRLVGPSGRAADGLPIELGAFLSELLKVKPMLRINILIWDFAALYAVEREWHSADKFTVESDDRIQFCMDASLPLGSSEHQKIVVIDHVVAFVGGLDLTIRRWDTSEHLAAHPLRHDPDGKAYPPFHDVQCMVGRGRSGARRDSDSAMGNGRSRFERLRNCRVRTLACIRVSRGKAGTDRYRTD